jgi:tRNA modification GTPase
MDLSQAEAVADLIASQSDIARKVALRQMKGGFSDQLKELRTRLLEFTSLLELELDFPEEDVEFADRTQLKEHLDKIEQVVTRLAKSFAVGNAIKNGVPVAIVGPTNAGKSTLLNALLGEERAIVSDIHGTIRDTIEDTIDIEGITFRFIDTAGIRKTDDTIENIGIDRTYSKIQEAEIVVLMLDSSSEENERQEIITDVVARVNFDSQKLIIVYNKSDIASVSEGLATDNACDTLHISAHNRDDIKTLQEALLHTIDLKDVETDETIVTNMRHYEALSNSLSALQRVKEGLETQLSGEFVAMDIHEVLDELGSITGEVSSQDVLNNIFRKFCIGK